MSPVDFAIVLRHFGESAGLPDLVLDEDGACALVFDDLLLHLVWDEEEQLLFVRAAVGQLSEIADNRALYEELLGADCLGSGTGGLSLGLDPFFPLMVLSGRLAGREITAARFHDYVESFVNMAGIWSERIKAVQEGREAASPRPDTLPFPGIRV